YNTRSQLLRQPQWQAAPGLSRNFKFGVGRRKVWSGLAHNQKKLVVQVCNLGIPLLLESVSSGPFLAATKIKSIHAIARQISSAPTTKSCWPPDRAPPGGLRCNKGAWCREKEKTPHLPRVPSLHTQRAHRSACQTLEEDSRKANVKTPACRDGAC